MKLKVLFLCTGNSCRSQMAEGWCRHFHSDEIDAYSAGIETHGLNPWALKVMEEAGVNISTHESTNVKDLSHIEFDYVFTVCDHANQNCPFHAAKCKLVHAPFDDPPKLAKGLENEEEILQVYRRVRDEIREYIKNLKEKFD